MSIIFGSFEELVGNTPLFEAKNISKYYSISTPLYLKLEYFNPAGSVKDRVALNMINAAEKQGLVNADSIIIEPTSGNTGIGLAALAASRGYKAIMVMPETMSIERQKLLKAFGAEIVLTEGSLGMSGAVEKATQLSKTIPNSFIPSQFDNEENPNAHYLTTGPEIWGDTDGDVDIFVATFGTGGTVSGTGKYLKEKNPNIKIMGVEPLSSPLVSEGKSGSHTIQGIGANFVPKTLDTSILDEIITVSDEDAFSYAKVLALKEGILVGISSGAALKAATVVALRPENKGKRVVVLLPDTGERYMSTELF